MSRMKAANRSTICWPGGISASSPRHDLAHSSMSGHTWRRRIASSGARIWTSSGRTGELAMLITRLLNACHHFPGFVYAPARLIEATNTIEIDVRPRRGSKPRCSCCGKPCAGYDTLAVRRFEFIPVWGYAVLLLYCMRRVDCRTCGVKVEQVPWAIGKHTLTQAYMLHLAHWARKLS